MLHPVAIHGVTLAPLGRRAPRAERVWPGRGKTDQNLGDSPDQAPRGALRNKQGDLYHSACLSRPQARTFPAMSPEIGDNYSSNSR